MNILVLNPSPAELEYSFCRIPEYKIPAGKILKNWQAEDMSETMKRIVSDINKSFKNEKIEAIAIRAAMGGTEFKAPVIVTDEAREKIIKLFPQAPMHLPLVVNLIDITKEILHGIPVVAVFDSGFFANLPHREAFYGVGSDLSNKLNLRRYGYHGLFHKAASEESGKVISICLEPRPETAAIADGRALMVTSGATPIEGIPGQKSCGDIDASIVLALSEKKGWTPEQINIELTEKSGIRGLAGKNVTIAEVFRSEDKKIKCVAEIIFYKILIACGMAAAAMGGVDRIVFSGRYAEETADIIKEKLEKKLKGFCKRNKSKIKWTAFKKTINEIIAEDALITILKNK
ncbi:MAG: hypothetical protein WC496_06445 [Phycisphaerae bacterium]|jgi:acetate kinase